MAIVVNLTNSTNTAVYVAGHAHSISEHGDLTVTAESGTTIGVHNRTQWTSIQYGELAQPDPQPEPM